MPPCAGGDGIKPPQDVLEARSDVPLAFDAALARSIGASVSCTVRTQRQSVTRLWSLSPSRAAPYLRRAAASGAPPANAALWFSPLWFAATR
jgi:hypothetical protein